MTDSSLSPAPIRRLEPGEQNVIVSKCLKCRNEIKLAVDNLTRAEVQAAIEKFDHNMGECPGGFHYELGGWRRLWDLDKAVNAFFDAKEGRTPKAAPKASPVTGMTPHETRELHRQGICPMD